MALFKMSDYVEYNGESLTLSDLDSKGIIEFKHFHEDHIYIEKPKNYYYAMIKGTDIGWQIRKNAYLSRTGQKVVI